MNRARMQFLRAECEKLTHYSVDKGYKSVIPIKAPLTRELAKELQCAYVYKPNGDMQEHFNGLNLESKLRDVDLCLPSGTTSDSFDEYRPEIVWKFKISVDDNKLFVTFLAHVMDHEFDILAFHKKWGDCTFECAIVSAQGQFDWTAEAPGGTAVDMATGEKQEDADEGDEPGPLFKCDDCENDVPLEAGEHTDPKTGEVRRCMHPNAKPAGGNAPLPSLQQMDGRKKPKPRGRANVTQMPSAADIEAEVSVN